MRMSQMTTELTSYSLSTTAYVQPLLVPVCKSPHVLKMSTITPVPKNSKTSCHYDNHPVAPTSVIIKCFKRLVTSSPPSQTPYNRSNLHTAPADPYSTFGEYSDPLSYSKMDSNVPP